MSLLKKVLVLSLVACIFVDHIDAKLVARKRLVRRRARDTPSHVESEKINEDEGEERGMLGNLLNGLNGGFSNTNTQSRPVYIQPPPIVPQGSPVAPTVNIPSINNQQSYPTQNRPSLLGGLLGAGGGLLSILDFDKQPQQQQQTLNMEWVRYALQRCARFDTRKLTTILPTAANGLTAPKIYYFANATSDVKTWEDAERFCTANGMDLLTINDAAENAVIQQKVKEILATSPVTPDDTTGPANPNQFWIGLQDINQDGTFNWVGDGTSSFTDWHAGAPAANSPDGCVALNQFTSADNIHMTNYDCTDVAIKFRYICEVSDECMGLFMSLLRQRKQKPTIQFSDSMGYGSHYKN